MGAAPHTTGKMVEAQDVLCVSCGKPLTAPGDVCAACNFPQPAGDGEDLFAFLGVPCLMNLDAAQLQQIFHERSRKLHPDRFQKSGPEALANSMARSALLNKAYRVLRDFSSRIAYLLESEKELLGLEANKAADRNVPVELAEEYFEMQEALAEGDKEALSKIQTRVNELKAETAMTLEHLAVRWDTEKLGEGRRGQTMMEERKDFTRDLEKTLQLQAYLARMEEDIGRTAAGGAH